MPNSGLKNDVTLNMRSPKDTFQLGVAFGASAQGGEVIALTGPLGAGKTQFVKGLALGLGVPPGDVTSPTFALMQSYAGRLRLTHIDLYRLEGQSDMCTLGLEEEIEDDAGLAAIEWADKGECLLPPGRLMLQLTLLEEDVREIIMQATDAVHLAWLIRSVKDYTEAQTVFASKVSK